MCKSEEIKDNVKDYIELFIKDADIDAYKKLKELSSKDYSVKGSFSICENQDLVNRYKSEQRAKLFREKASTTDLEQRIVFLDTCILLLPKDSHLAFDFYRENARAQVFLYRLCKDKDFREELKKENGWSEEQLNSAYAYDEKAVTSNNLVYAIQTLNEATRFAKNLDEINIIDEQVKEIIELNNK